MTKLCGCDGMSKPPKSKIAIVLFIISVFFAFGTAFAIYKFVQTPGDTQQGTLLKITVLGLVRYSGIATLITFVSGYVIQMISDIRWKLFEGDADNA